jgi:hypothetical protein
MLLSFKRCETDDLKLNNIKNESLKCWFLCQELNSVEYNQIIMNTTKDPVMLNKGDIRKKKLIRMMIDQYSPVY